ncbi:MAG: hypothetical protein AAGB26_08175 [Planctomycetota bacterium]
MAMLVGCTTPQIDSGPSNLSLGLMMIPGDNGKTMRPAVMLVGDGMLLVEKVSEWALIGSLPDGEPVFMGGESFGTDSLKTTLLANYGVDALPTPEPGMGWSVRDPVWFGPKYDAKLINQLEFIAIRCNLSYLSRDYRLVEARFEWQVHPEREPADSLIYISD